MHKGVMTLVAVLSAVLGSGCRTPSRGLHTVPTSRDYGQLERTDIGPVEVLVDQAHRVGCGHYAPYEYFLARFYLETAKRKRSQGDMMGAWDYAGLAREMAEAAIRKGGIPDRGPAPIVEGEQASRAEFERVKARYEELDRTKAIEVSPVLYAHLTTTLSLAEHEIEAGRYDRGATGLAEAETDIDTIWSQDVDGDGIADMNDGAPWAPEDMDGFEDDDGVPDPDNDGDGIWDVNDVMPNDPEAFHRWHDHDGAPDEYPVLESICFDLGRTELSGEARGYLRGILVVLLEWPELKLRVEGYADETRDGVEDIYLAHRRAVQVRDYLMEHGCPASRIEVAFFEDAEREDESETARGQADAPRVELEFF